MADNVIFRPKSPGQRDDCIRSQAGCSKQSTLEAFVEYEGKVEGCSTMRCCDDEECKKFAADLAQLGADALSKG